jgi:hypothetical protein
MLLMKSDHTLFHDSGVIAALAPAGYQQLVTPGTVWLKSNTSHGLLSFQLLFCSYICGR